MSGSKSRSSKKNGTSRSTFRKKEPDAYTSKIVKYPSKQQLESELRHAVRHGDYDALEEYDDWGEY